jgi:hypothetical protein
LAWLNQPQTQLIGLGKFAADISPMPVALQADLSGFQGSDEDFIQSFFVPGIQRAGGLQAVLDSIR